MPAQGGARGSRKDDRKKKAARPPKIRKLKEVVFDEDARKEYLTGFSKRKKARELAVRTKAIGREKEEARENRKTAATVVSRTSLSTGPRQMLLHIDPPWMRLDCDHKRRTARGGGATSSTCIMQVAMLILEMQSPQSCPMLKLREGFLRARWIARNVETNSASPTPLAVERRAAFIDYSANLRNYQRHIGLRADFFKPVQVRDERKERAALNVRNAKELYGDAGTPEPDSDDEDEEDGSDTERPPVAGPTNTTAAYENAELVTTVVIEEFTLSRSNSPVDDHRRDSASPEAEGAKKKVNSGGTGEKHKKRVRNKPAYRPKMTREDKKARATGGKKVKASFLKGNSATKGRANKG
ncbi:ribosomal RNA-processing protein 17, partial [Phenoliferia sp. Uapishka_3]